MKKIEIEIPESWYETARAIIAEQHSRDNEMLEMSENMLNQIVWNWGLQQMKENLDLHRKVARLDAAG